MSHELTIRADQTAEMAFTGETPWHHLGQRLDANATIEQWQTAAGMDWKIQRSKVRYFADAQGSQQFEMEDQPVLFRLPPFRYFFEREVFAVGVKAKDEG